MAYFALDGQFTDNKSVTIDLKKVLNGFGANSMVFINRDAGDDVLISFDSGQTFCRVSPSKQRVVTGLSGFTSIVLNSNNNSAGEYSVAISSDVQPPIIEY